MITFLVDGPANHSGAGVWIAAQRWTPCTFVVVCNGVYHALKQTTVLICVLKIFPA